MKGENALFSSAKHERNGERGNDNWETPTALVRAIEDRFFTGQRFEIDLAGSEANKKAPLVLTEQTDALTCKWPVFQRAFCNPPYSIADRFMERAIRELNAVDPFAPNRIICFLVPARLDKAIYRKVEPWIHKFVFLTGRVTFHIDGEPVRKFNTLKSRFETNTATFPTMLVILSSHPAASRAEFWDWKKEV